MKLVLFTGKENINNYITNNFEDIQVFVCLSSENLLSMVKENSADRVIITSAAMPPEVDHTKSLIIKLLKETSTSISYLYGQVENISERDVFRKFLFSKGVFNFYDGIINSEVIKNTIYNDLTANDWKSVLLEDMSMDFEGNADSSETSSIEVVEKIVRVDNYITFKQVVVGLFGFGGKTSNGLHIAAHLSNLYNLKVCFVDMNVRSPALSYYLDTDNAKSFLSGKDECYTYFEKYPNLHLLNGIGSDAFNFRQTAKYENATIVEVIDSLKNAYDVVIIDTDGDMNVEMNRWIYQRCNKKLFFSSLTYGHLEMLRTIQKNGFMNDSEQTFLILNQNIDDSITIKEVKNVIELDNVFTVGVNPLAQALNKASILDSEAYLKQIKPILAALTKLPVAEDKKASGLKSVFKKFKSANLRSRKE